MRQGLCRRNAENPDARPVPGAPRVWRVLFHPSGGHSFLFFGLISFADLALFDSRFPVDWPFERRLNRCQYPRFNFAARVGREGGCSQCSGFYFSQPPPLPPPPPSPFYFLSFSLFSFLHFVPRVGEGRGGGRKKFDF